MIAEAIGADYTHDHPLLLAVLCRLSPPRSRREPTKRREVNSGTNRGPASSRGTRSEWRRRGRSGGGGELLREVEEAAFARSIRESKEEAKNTEWEKRQRGKEASAGRTTARPPDATFFAAAAGAECWKRGSWTGEVHRLDRLCRFAGRCRSLWDQLDIGEPRARVLYCVIEEVVCAQCLQQKQAQQ